MLESLFMAQAGQGQESTLDIVVVPAAGVSRPSEWIDASAEPAMTWLESLVCNVVPNANVLEHLYQHERQGSIVQKLLQEGAYLLEALHDLCVKKQSKKVPLVFVCHGTGAFVLKHALCICRQQPFQYRPVIDVVAGAIFLGAPHFVKANTEVKTIFDSLLKCQRRGIGRSLSSDDDIEALIAICKAFELMNLTVPIVSAYESKETSTQQKLFSKLRGKSRNPVIVPKGLGVLRAYTETPIDSEANHYDVCKVPIGSPLYKAAERLVRDVMAEAPQRIFEANQPYATPVGLKDNTLRSLSSIGYTVMDAVVIHQGAGPISSPLGQATGGSTAGSFEIVPAEDAFEGVHRNPELPCFSIGNRQRLENFQGRQELLDIIDKHLLPYPPNSPNSNNRNSPPTASDEEFLHSFAICGPGGIGKTELAVEYAFSRKEKFEAIFWLSADDPNILASGFAQIAQSLKLGEDNADLAASRDIVMGWLAEPLRKTDEADTPENSVNWIIIFDNVDKLDVLSDFWPKFGRGSVLVTSRDPFAKDNIYTKTGLNLQPLSGTESEALMESLTRVNAENYQKNALETIAKELGGFPLAIRQMSAVFRSMRLSYTDFLKYYNEEGIERLLSRLSGSTDSHGVISFVTLWSLDRLSAGTKALLQVISLLDPDSVPEEILINTSNAIELEHYPKSHGEYYDARSELISTSLITQNAEQEDLSLHRLIQDIAKACMSREQLISSFQAASNLVIAAWTFQSIREHHSAARFAKCERVLPSVLRLRNCLEALLKNSTDLTLDIDVARLFNDAGWYMFERGLPEETKPFCELGLLIGNRLKKKLGLAAMEVIRESHCFLGIALVETNEHGPSLRHKKKWLSMLEERVTADRQPVEDYELGYAYNELGVACGNKDMLEDAAEAFRRSIAIFQGLDDYDDIMLGWPEPNLGFIYTMQGKLEDAEQALVEILDIHAAAFGVDDTESFKTGKILYGMGNVLEAQKRFDESLNFHCRCFEQFKKVLGLKHHRFGDICHKIAGHRMRQGLHEEALEYFDIALTIFQSRPYLTNERSRTTFYKSKLYRRMGQNEKADELLDEAYKMWKQMRPGDLRTSHQLEERDFDLLISFWSR